MRFTSGGTDGPRFDVEAYGLDGNNVYGALLSARSASAAAEAFYGAGWRVRKSTSTDFEVEHTYAELELAAGDSVRFSGSVLPWRINDLLYAFGAIRLEYQLELYDQDGDLIATAIRRSRAAR